MNLSAALAGLGLGLGLIVAIGAQNAFVLRQGLLGRHVGAVVAICAGSDAMLIMAGVGGAAAVLERAPALETVARLGGAAFLLAYGLLSARRALRPKALHVARATSAGLATTVLTCLALTWLNPHVYLDTLVLIGTIASTYGEDRWSFGAGAVLAGLTWFTALAYGAARLRPVFARPRAWQVLDAVIAVVMLTLAAALALGT